jgi:dihydroorotate dehydrogenase (fumarate)
MDLKTEYMGLKLKTPLVVSACQPLSDEIDKIRAMEDAGAGAVVLYSLFEEQLTLERYELNHHLEAGTDSFPESLSYFPEPREFTLGPEEYLEHIRKAKAAVGIPVVASLNGASAGGWIDFAKQMQQAGADALELNVYFIPTDMNLTGAEVEQRYIDILQAVKAAVSIPVAVKLSPFFSNLANMAMRLDNAGADGLVLCNRFYQPDIDLENLEIKPQVLLSTPQAIRIPLRWIAILCGRIKADLAATSGIHTGEDVVKMLMVGASATMLCSVLLRRGIPHLRTVEQELIHWMEEHEYESVRQMQGSMCQYLCPNPTAFERAQYMRALISYKPSQETR